VPRRVYVPNPSNPGFALGQSRRDARLLNADCVRFEIAHNTFRLIIAFNFRDDHRDALAAIGDVWDAPEGSDDPIKLDLLVIMVERYEVIKSLTEASLLPSRIDGIPIDAVAVGPIDACESELKRTRA
jgi:hypothetical protein